MNKNSTKIRKRMSLVLAGALVLTMTVGSLAYFTDRVDKSATGTAGTLDLVFTDTSLASESSGDKVQAIDKVWDAGKLTIDGGILNPGDTIDMDYKIANAGNKSMDVKQQITLVSSVALTDDAEEYKISVAGMTITPVKSADDKTLVYDLGVITLNGTGAGAETEQDVSIIEKEYDVAMAFDRLAKNAFQGSTVSVKLDIQAKQHRNTTDGDWADWASYTTSYEQK